MAKNLLFYTENGKFFISRHVVEAAFIQFVGSLQPEKWKEETLKLRFEMLLKNRDHANDGVFVDCFAQADAAGLANWVLTDVPICGESPPKPQSTLKVLVKSSDQKKLEYEQIEYHHLDGIDIEDLEDYDVVTKPIDWVPSSCDRKIRKNSASKTSAATNNIDGKPKVKSHRFAFADFDIPIGATLTLFNDENETIEVVNDALGVRYTGPQEIHGNLSLTSLTRAVMHKRETTNISPINYWCYNGVRLRQMFNERYGNTEKTEENVEEQDTPESDVI